MTYALAGNIWVILSIGWSGVIQGSVLRAFLPVRQSGVPGVGLPKGAGAESVSFVTYVLTGDNERRGTFEGVPKQEVAMAFKTRVLVLANQTADSEGLLEALRRRAERGDVAFTLLVPGPRARAEQQLEAGLE